ncbi:hypothetical protein N0V82_001283 [Gnomoniopsis sp. IMI 355080]|nr:hypothetical protein N0V82_001283 [Gnomoniopsis sp. IMI 355080]
MSTVTVREGQVPVQKQAVIVGEGKEPSTSRESLPEALSLGVPLKQKKFFWQRSKAYDPDAIATLPSVYDDPETAKRYKPRDDWENVHRFDPSARWTWGEENALVRKIDLRIMLFAIITFMALEIDRANIAQALSDNFLADLDLSTNDYNLGQSVFKLAFLLSELPSQLVSKWVGPDRWIPAQLSLWSAVACSQFWLSGRASFLTTRAILGALQGGFIPDVILYLSYFYTHSELSIRLGYFWVGMSLADIASALLAYGILHMRGVAGIAGWRWLFLIEGIFTLCIGLLAFGLMPAGPCQTSGWLRGKNGWFSEREETIIVNRALREDPSKSDMHNREPVTPKLLWKSLKDFDLWPLYIVGLMFQVPTVPQTSYLTLTLKNLGWSTFNVNLLTIPYYVAHFFTMLGLTYLAELWHELTLTAMIGQLWTLPLLIAMVAINQATTNNWVIYTIIVLLLIYPNAHPIQVAWNSRNANSVRTRTVSAACYNMFVQAGAIIGANIYRADDAPYYPRGNKVCLIIACVNILLYAGTKVYYVWRNKQKDKIWKSLTEDERLEYLSNPPDEGNKRLDFRFHH